MIRSLECIVTGLAGTDAVSYTHLDVYKRQTPTNPAAGVIATRPATAPEAAPSIEGLPLIIHSANIQDSAAQALSLIHI